MSCSSAAISARKAAASANSNTPSGPPARLWSRWCYDDRLNKQGTCLNKAEGVEEKNNVTDLPRDLCGLRRTAGWTLEGIVIPPGGARDDVRVVRADLDILE